MRLLTPLGLAAGALAAPLVLWYLLRSRRPRVEVASTYLWRRTDLTMSAALPWQRFRGDRTFWLVLAALLAGALALAQPALPVAAQLGDHTIVIVDASGSMLADEDGPTRLELARREARGLADRMAAGQVMSVVEAGPRARTLLSASGDPAAVRRALNAVTATHGHADLADAFTLAGALERPGQPTVVHLLTDGEVPPEVAALAPAGLVVAAVGSERPNLAVTRLEAAPAGAGEGQVFAQVRNFSTLPAAARLTVSVDEADVTQQELRLAPRGTEDLLLPIDPAFGDGSGLVVVQATVAPMDDPPGDALATDDAAWAVLAGRRELTALVAGPGNVFVEAALSAVEGVEVRTAPGVPDDLAGVDLLVVDRVPAPARTGVPTVYVAPASPPAGVAVTGSVELPVFTYQASDHPLLADVDLSDVAVAAAQAVEAPALTTLASGPGGPLLLAGRLGSTPAVYVPFDLLASNLPLQVAWPVLAANSVDWLTGPPTAAPLPAGAELTVPVPPDATAVSARSPAGATVTLDPGRPRLRVDHVGVWEITYEGVEEPPHLVAVNAPPDQSDLARRRPPPRTDPAGDLGSVGAPTAQGVQAFGRTLLAVVVVLLCAEWAGAHGFRPLHRLALRRRRTRGRAVAR